MGWTEADFVEKTFLGIFKKNTRQPRLGVKIDHISTFLVYLSKKLLGQSCLNEATERGAKMVMVMIMIKMKHEFKEEEEKNNQSSSLLSVDSQGCKPKLVSLHTSIQTI